MEKVAFNNKGFEAKKAQLFGLQTEELQNELFNLVYNTKEWVKSNFILSNEQVVKLDEQPREFLRALNFAPTEFCYN
ncbi:hypothetical protein NWE55_00605 [Myroides albus]|uniref:Uncharacterized protein n=1 Tax=Myroides albus TaxID=2562892 RepID=A0A6I3LNH9_9FLAO|nr:hypothetical protein [Myroides albus]MTG99287.1 hypothetical protein [Myroides albus]UVD79829.1 hypothetical protein NWE55_00605 [Myroides albus]